MKYEFMNKEPLLEIKDLKVKFPGRKQMLTAVDGVNLQIRPGEIVGVVGESGSGKSVMSQSILRLREYDSAVQYEGQILFEGKDILKLSQKEMRALRGNRIAVIFQDPMTSLSPVHTVGKQMIEVLLLHKKISRTDAKKKCIELLQMVGIANPENCYKKYPYELSGGMQQRVMIAMALACEPALLIADEPTTALDVTIQEQILNLIGDLNEKMGMSVLFITHDLGAMAQLCHSVRVMYLGNLVEEADTEELFANTLHPYTQALFASVPDFERKERKVSLTGELPQYTDEFKGCVFHTRCPYATEECCCRAPEMKEVCPGHRVACHRVG